ncbi:MAG: glycogen debranching protein GlgX [Acidimicrobiales bacterium]
MHLTPGQPYPLGATYDGAGVNFSLFSSVAESVQLCLFDVDAGGAMSEQRVELEEVDGHVWHTSLTDVGPGQRYGWRIKGPWDPANGLWCNENKLLLDPYAKAIDGLIDWDQACFPYDFGDPTQRNDLDSASHVSKGVVINPYFDWGHDRPPAIPLSDSVIYEVHVKGFTKLHPGIPEDLRGTYAGLSHPVAIDHLAKLGVTAVELLPVHQFVHDNHLREQGLRNYWGYNTIGFLAPHNEYAATSAPGGAVQEFKQMVRSLHDAGIEVILDVVYNHTAEGNHMGPILSLKGIDNPAYYRLMDDDRRHYMDYTGTGNSMNMRHPHVLQLIMDSLRYWITEMHVDGFRFDLAATLARELHEVDRLSAFFDIIQQDPIISQVKLIAEPWDIGEGGYQVGKFPPLWSEWNGRYRDNVRDVWRGSPGTVGELGDRLTGSSDLYEGDARRPTASVNFVTAHDGFTLADLVAYNDKHNEANGEDGRDGSDDNRSWNVGVEGPTDDPEILEVRRRQQRNILTTLLLSQGIPMLLGGDELGRTQGGNNNGYCQDNEVSWFDWESVDEDLQTFTTALIAFRADHPVFRRRRFFQGVAIHGHVDDIAWFRPDGEEMGNGDWEADSAARLGMFINGSAISTMDRFGERITDESYLLLVNAHHEAVEWTLPSEPFGASWIRVIDTAKSAAVAGVSAKSAAVAGVSAKSAAMAGVSAKSAAMAGVSATSAAVAEATDDVDALGGDGSVIDGGAALTLAPRSVVVLQAVPPADSSAEGVAP